MENTETNPEHEKLIETLKFTPRTYKLRLWGYGGEYVMGTVNRKTFDYFREHRLSVEEFAWDYDYVNEHRIPDDLLPFDAGQWNECSDIGHCWGVDRSAGTVQVDDENGDTVYEKELGDISGWGNDGDPPEPEWSFDEEYWIDSQPAGTVVFVGVSSEKGTFFEADLDLTAPFDASKLCFAVEEIDGNEIVTGVSYDGVSLDNYGGDTNGKSSDFGFYIAGSQKDNKWIKYKNMDDIEYGLTDWFPAKTKPVRFGLYEVETEDNYKYQAEFKDNGKWYNTWNDRKSIKIKQWRGVAYDPDTHVFNDMENFPEPQSIVSDVKPKPFPVGV